jgi:hypothetical protein
MQSLRMSQESEAQGTRGGMVVALLLGDQRQGCRQIQHGLGQGDPQEQAHLSDAERQRGMRVQAGHFIWRGQRTCGHGAQDPPRSGSGAEALEAGNDEPGCRASYDGASRAKNAAHTGPYPVLPCMRQNTSRWAGAYHSRAHMWQASSPGERYRLTNRREEDTFHKEITKRR